MNRRWGVRQVRPGVLASYPRIEERELEAVGLN